MSYPLGTLRKVLTAARPDMTGEQQDAADALLAALAPPMEEPAWPGAPVIAACPAGEVPSLHTRRNNGPDSGWECEYCAFTPWPQLVNPRPLTDEERAEYGIPMPAEPVTDELVDRCVAASPGFTAPRWARAILRAAGHPEATR